MRSPEKEKNGPGGDTARGGKFQKAEAPPSEVFALFVAAAKVVAERRGVLSALLCHACLHHRSIKGGRKGGRGDPSKTTALLVVSDSERGCGGDHFDARCF